MYKPRHRKQYFKQASHSIGLWKKSFPSKIVNQLLTAKTGSEACELVRKKEKVLANFIDPSKEGYLDCDEAASILAQILDAKGIAYRWVNGVSAEGSAHAYLQIVENGQTLDLDPTDQLPKAVTDLSIDALLDEKRLFEGSSIKSSLTPEGVKRYRLKRYNDVLAELNQRSASSVNKP